MMISPEREVNITNELCVVGLEHLCASVQNLPADTSVQDEGCTGIKPIQDGSDVQLCV